MVKRPLLEAILDLEWEMFVCVRSDRNAPCQSAPDNFRTIRGSLFEMWTDAMLASYLDDLQRALAQGRNLLTEKYARMDNLIAPLNTHPLIDAIVAIEDKWQSELQRCYPALYQRCCRGRNPSAEDGSNFSVYLRCELETYGNRTLELYHQNVKSMDDQKQNLAIEALRQLVRKSGYQDLEQAEVHLRNMASVS